MLKICTGKGQYGLSERATYKKEGLPILRMGNINNGRIHWDDLKYIELSRHEKEKYLLNDGDLIFNRTNSAELVGKTAVFKGSRESVFASYLIRFRLDNDIADPNFISAYINSEFGREFIKQNMARAIGQVNISATTMHKMPIPLPTITEQKTIMDKLSIQLDFVAELKKALETQLVFIGGLPSAILCNAFSGSV